MRSNRGVIAAGHELTARAGADVLADGGNAIDAAVAAMAMSCLVEPVLSSPGGGGFAMVRHGSTGRVELIDFFPHTPRRRNPDADRDGVWRVEADFGTATQPFMIGPATAATPGFPRGVRALAELGGSVGIDDLFAPAVGAARLGVAISPFQADLARVVAPILTATEVARGLFAPGGDLIAVGDRFRNPGLADALEQLAKADLADTEVGAAIVAGQSDGHLSADDLARYQTIGREPLPVRIGAFTVHLNPPPSAGGVLIAHALGGLSDGADPLDLARAFRSTEAARSTLVAEQIRAKGTTHISVVDSDGTACSVTVSNGEGNGELVGPFGFMLNNILGEEDVNPDGVAWPVDTRLASMMCPTIMESDDGDLVVLGTGGSNRIRTALAQVLARIALAGETIDVAVDAPRLHVEGEHLDFEDRYGSAVAEALVADFPDHLAWPEPSLFYGGVHTVRRHPDATLSGQGDHRRAGVAIVV